MWALYLDFESSQSGWGLGFSLTRICYRGASCLLGIAAGMWSMYLNGESSSIDWSNGFSLIRICYRGADCSNEGVAGLWALRLSTDSSSSHWTYGFWLEFVIVAVSVPLGMDLVCGRCAWTERLRAATGASV